MAWIEKITAWFYASRRKLATAGVALLTMLMAYHVIFGANGMLTYERKKTEYRNLQNELDSLQKENGRLQQEVKALRTDPKTIEREAREQLRYARPGEVIYTLPAPANQPPASMSAQKR